MLEKHSYISYFLSSIQMCTYICMYMYTSFLYHFYIKQIFITETEIERRGKRMISSIKHIKRKIDKGQNCSLCHEHEHIGKIGCKNIKKNYYFYIDHHHDHLQLQTIPYFTTVTARLITLTSAKYNKIHYIYVIRLCSIILKLQPSLRSQSYTIGKN